MVKLELKHVVIDDGYHRDKRYSVLSKTCNDCKEYVYLGPGEKYF